jgi:predicted nuclease of predicted toxin-antitoxin system
MRFLLDMGLAQSTARHLRDQGLQQLSDKEIVVKAQIERRAILTHDLDFGRIIALSQSHLPSVVTFRLSSMRPDQVNRYLDDTLDRFAQELGQGALVSVNEEAIRVRPLPV